MNGRFFARLGISIGLALGLCACAGPAPVSSGYFGPTKPLDEVVRTINQNNSRLPTLWAHISWWEAWIINPDTKKTQYVNGQDGTVLYAAPASIRVTAKKEFDDIFDLASDGDKFWLWQKHDSIFWYGNFAHLNDAGAKQIPIRPDLVLEVLGVRPIDETLTDEPVPVMRFNNDSDAYMIVWQVHRADRWVAQKEIWYDRTTLLPSTVILFDENGRVVVRAWLSEYVAVALDNVPKENWPQVATRYRLFFAQQQTHMNFTLADVVLKHNGFPKPISFVSPDIQKLRDDGVKMIQVDEDGGN